MRKIRIIAALAILAFMFVLTACGKETGNKTEISIDDLGIDFSISGNTATLADYDTTNPVVAMQIEGYGAVVVELYPDVAPNTANNFIALVRSGFYDDNNFHRSVPGFMIQGGDPDGKGTGGPGYTIKGEFTSNGFKNTLKHTEGIISMGRTDLYDTAGSQFFIMLGTATYLDGDYAAFGKVIAGMDTVKAIAANEETSSSNSEKLKENVKIIKMIVDTKGHDYPAPETIAE